MVMDMPQYNSSTDASKRAYTKPHLTFSEQVEQLKNRGMIINDAAFAEHVLATVGYYRMSGYWYPFRKQIEGQSTRSDDFIDGVSFEEVNKLRLFDKRLSSVLFEMITDIEVAFRCKIAYTVGKGDPFDYCLGGSCIDPRFQNSQKYSDWIDKHNKQIEKSSETFVQHYNETYSSPFPIWISCELWDFGMTSKFYDILNRKYKDGIAASLGIKKSSVLAGWLHSLNIIRNICAHNARLWNRTLVAISKTSDDIPGLEFLAAKYAGSVKIAPMIFITLWLTNTVLPESESKKRLAVIIDSFCELRLPGISYSDMGFKEDWKTEKVWQ